MRIIVSLVLIALSSVAFADAKGELNYRQGVMKAVGGQMSSMAAILRGRVHMDNLKLHASAMADLASIVPNVFPEGSGEGKTEALPAIWEKPAEFKEAIETFVSAVRGFSSAADSGDMSRLGSGIQKLGQACKGCHDNFRAEHDD